MADLWCAIRGGGMGGGVRVRVATEGGCWIEGGCGRGRREDVGSGGLRQPLGGKPGRRVG